MNKELNIETRRRSFSPNVVTLLVGIVVALVLGSLSAQAQTSTETTASNATVDSSITIPVKGTLNDPSGAITVSGSVVISARRVIDTTSATTPSIVVLDLDFSGVKGTTGTSKNLTVYVTGGNRASEIRPLQASDTIIVTCPYFDSAKGALSARTMLVNATLNFDISSGKLTSGSISVGNNVVSSAMVGGTASM